MTEGCHPAPVCLADQQARRERLRLVSRHERTSAWLLGANLMPKRRRLVPVKRTPAMRAGIHRVKSGDDLPKVPELSRLLYKPWLFPDTPL